LFEGRGDDSLFEGKIWFVPISSREEVRETK
jgi:hypothetical protein